MAHPAGAVEAVAAKLGDYCTGSLLGVPDTRQGVLVLIEDDHVLLVGQHSAYRCRPDLNVVPDHRLFGETMRHVAAVRREIGVAS